LVDLLLGIFKLECRRTTGVGQWAGRYRAPKLGQIKD
jgi:hypothetical protein